MTVIKVHGLEELRQTLRRTLPDHLHKTAVQGALKKAADPMVKAARNLAPKKSGVLRRAIHQMRSRLSRGTYQARIIRVRHGKKQQKNNRDAFYWRFIEFGHAIIRAKEKASLGTPEKGFFGKEVQAVPARPFMRPAFESGKFGAIEIFRRSLADEIQKVAVRASRTSASRLSGRLFRTLTGF
jgi:HK97 gp10 family phage protein